MATINDLLGLPTTGLEKMTEEELAIYLADITSLEPISYGAKIIESDPCPIKKPKKKTNKGGKLTMEEELKNLDKMLEEL